MELQVSFQQGRDWTPGGYLCVRFFLVQKLLIGIIKDAHPVI